MRRELRQALPGLAHYFGIRPWEVEDLTYGEITEFLRLMKQLPPIGGVALVDMNKTRR